LTTPSLSR